MPAGKIILQPKYTTRQRKYTKPKYHKKKKKNAKIGRYAVARGLRPAILPFSRTYETVIDLTSAATYPPWMSATTDGGVVGTFIARLSDLPNFAEFQPLFTQYKINAVQMKIFSQYTAAQAEASGTANGEQIIIKYAKNTLGKPLGQGDTKALWLQKQAKKERRLLQTSAKAFQLYFKTQQKDLIFDNTAPAADDFVLIRPHWNSIYSSSSDFVGLDIRFDTASGVAIPLNPNPLTIPKITIQCKFYMQMRQVT